MLMLELPAAALAATAVPGFMAGCLALAAYPGHLKTGVRGALAAAGYCAWAVLTGALAEYARLHIGYWLAALPVGCVPAILLLLAGRDCPDRFARPIGIGGIAATLLATAGIAALAFLAFPHAASPAAALDYWMPLATTVVGVEAFVLLAPPCALASLGLALFCGRFTVSLAGFAGYAAWNVLLFASIWQYHWDGWMPACWPEVYALLLTVGGLPHVLIWLSGRRKRDRLAILTGLCGIAAVLFFSLGLGAIFRTARYS